MPIHLPSSKIVYDRSRVVTDWKCPRAFYLNYKFDGRGIVPTTTPLELYLGTTIHDGTAVIAKMTDSGQGVDIDTIASTAYQQVFEALMQTAAGEVEELDFAKEQASLVEGLLRGFHKHVWPGLIARFPKILFVEEEMVYEHDDLTFMSRPDLVLADEDGAAWYIEYKSTSSKNPDWVNAWNTAVQLHSTSKAIEATKGVEVKGVIVSGLYKGYKAYGKQSSPFCYAYKKEGHPPFSQDQIQYEYKSGFKKFPVSDLEGGVKKWVEGMDELMLADQFPQTPPIFINQDLVSSFFNQQATRQKEIEMACLMIEDAKKSGDEEVVKQLLDVSFEQHFDQCCPAFGKPCAFRRICHGNCSNPLESGFEYREPHHELEAELLGGGEEG